MNTKSLNPDNVFLFSIITISVIVPIIGGVLIWVSCPGPAGLAYFPIVSARCPGEFIGDIALFCFGFPGLILSFVILYFLSAFVESLGNFFSPDFQLLFLVVLGLILNYIIYFFTFRFIFIMMQAKRWAAEEKRVKKH